MKNLKPTLCTLIAASTMTFVLTPTAHSNPYSNQGQGSYSSDSSRFTNSTNLSVYNGIYDGGFSHKLRKMRISDGSVTATLHYKKGLNFYENNRFEDAEKEFEKVLRLKGLNKQANLYLAHINGKLGNEEKMIKYAKAYHELKAPYKYELK